MTEDIKDLQKMIDTINSAQKMKLIFTVTATDDPSVNAEFIIDDCGKFSADKNSHGLRIDCDLPGDENENDTFRTFIGGLHDFYVRECKYHLITTFRAEIGGNEQIITGTIYELITYAKYCSLQLVSSHPVIQ